MLLSISKWIAAFSLFALSGTATAMNCSSPSADADGDGWGWENGASCQVVDTPTQTDQPDGETDGPISCTGDNPDPDGDGWGWENGASCQAIASSPTVSSEPVVCIGSNADPDGDGWGFENGQSCVAGPSVRSQGTVQVNQQFTSNLTGLESKQFSFSVAEEVSFELETNFQQFGSISSIVSDSNGNIVYESYSGTTGACIEAGTYTLTVTRDYIDTANSVDFSITIRTSPADNSCVKPTNIIELPSSYNFQFNDDGSFLYISYPPYGEESLVASDSSGSTLWQISLPGYINSFNGMPDGGAMVIYNDNNYSQIRVTRISNQGEIVWTNNYENYIYITTDFVVGDQSVLVPTDSQLDAYNISDGSLRWSYRPEQGTYVENATFIDGNYLVATNGTVIFLAE